MRKEEEVVGILGKAERRKNGAATHKGTNRRWTRCQQLQKDSCGGLVVSGSVRCCTEENMFGCSSSVQGQMPLSQFFRLLTRKSLADLAALCRLGLELLVVTVVMADTCLQLHYYVGSC